MLTTSEILSISIISAWLIFSFLGNLLIIACYSTCKKMRKNATNTFIFNLALSDMILGGIALPQQVHDIGHAEEDYHEGVFLCKFMYSLPPFCITSAVYTIILMTVERYRGVVHNIKTGMSVPLARKLAIAVWVWATAVSIPAAIENQVYLSQVNLSESEFSFNGYLTPIANYSFNGTRIYTVNIKVCGSPANYYQFGLAHSFFLLATSYVIPFIVLCVLYFVIIFYLRRQSRRIGTIRRQGKDCFAQNLRHRCSKRVIMMLLVVALVFNVVWLPYFITVTNMKLKGIDNTSNFNDTDQLIRLSLAALSTSYNLWIYLTFMKNFREHCKNLFKKVFKQQQNPSLSQVRTLTG